MRFDLRPLRLTTGWSEPNAVVSRTLSVMLNFKVLFSFSDFDNSPTAAFNTSLTAFANDRSIFRDEFHLWFFVNT